MPGQVERNSPLWEQLNKIWQADKKPGYVSLRDITYRAIAVNDDIVVFAEVGRLDSLYGSLSTSSRNVVTDKRRNK